MSSLSLSSSSVSSLTAQQQEILSHFQSIVNQPNEAVCIRLLAIHDWNLESAVSFALQVPDFASAQQENHQTNTNQNENSISASSSSSASQSASVPRSSSFMSSSRSSSSISSSSAPRSPSNSDSASESSPAPLSPSRFAFLSRLPGAGLVKGTFNLVRTATGAVYNYWTGSGEDGQPQHSEASQDASPEERFLLDFESRYPDLPPFFHGSYGEAVQMARSTGRMMFVYLHSETTQNAELFLRHTLSNESLRNFLRENFVCWTGNLLHSDAYKLSHTLKADRFPFYAVLAPSQQLGHVKVRIRRSGLIDPDDLIAELLQQMENQTAEEENDGRARNNRSSAAPAQAQAQAQPPVQARNSTPLSARDREIQAARHLREAQDAEYREALARDQEERKRQDAIEAEKRRKQAEEEEKERIKQEEIRIRRERADGRAAKREAIGQSEPSAGPGVVSISVRLPNSRKVQRRFNEESNMSAVFDWIGCQEFLSLPDGAHNPQDEESFSYQILSTHPKKVHSDPSIPIKQLGLGKQILFLAEIVEEQQSHPMEE